MLALKHFASLFTLVTFLVGSGSGQLVTPPLLPSVDPFYKPPSGFENQAPGSILRSRKIATAYFGLIPNPVQAWQLLYRTTAIDGSAIATVTTVFKPLNAKKDRFVSFHTEVGLLVVPLPTSQAPLYLLMALHLQASFPNLSLV